MKKEEREFQIVRSPKSTKLFHLLLVLPKSTKLFHLLLVLLLGTVSNCKKPTSFSRLHHFRHAVFPDLGLDLIRTKAISLCLGHPSRRRDSNSPSESHLGRAVHPLLPIISVAALPTRTRSSPLASLISPLVGFFFYTAQSAGKPCPQRQRYKK